MIETIKAVTVPYPYVMSNFTGGLLRYATREAAEAAARASVSASYPTAIVYEAIAQVEVQPTPVKISPVTIPS